MPVREFGGGWRGGCSLPTPASHRRTPDNRWRGLIQNHLFSGKFGPDALVPIRSGFDSDYAVRADFGPE
jgi:hypothetical protein